jgi:hypothetical protein
MHMCNKEELSHDVAIDEGIDYVLRFRVFSPLMFKTFAVCGSRPTGISQCLEVGARERASTEGGR